MCLNETASDCAAYFYYKQQSDRNCSLYRNVSLTLEPTGNNTTGPNTTSVVGLRVNCTTGGLLNYTRSERPFIYISSA